VNSQAACTELRGGTRIEAGHHLDLWESVPCPSWLCDTPPLQAAGANFNGWSQVFRWLTLLRLVRMRFVSHFFMK